METRRPVGGPLSHEFWAFVITAELRRPEFAGPGDFLCNFCCVFLKRPLTAKFSKFCSESLHGHTDRRCVLKCRKSLPKGEIAEIVHYLPDKKKTKFRLPLKLLLPRESRPKSTMASPNIWLTNSKFHPNRFTFGGLIAECAKAVLVAHP